MMAIKKAYGLIDPQPPHQAGRPFVGALLPTPTILPIPNQPLTNQQSHHPKTGPV